MGKINGLPVRQSNMELLRVVSMFLVLVVHADFFALGVPEHQQIVDSPVSSFMSYFIEALSIVCVNLFILISGYFGIGWKKKSIWNLTFQCVFYIAGIYLVLAVFGKAALSVSGIVQCIKNYWFIWAYVGLYLFAPLLNAFVEHGSRKTLGRFILVFYLFQFGFGWLTHLFSAFGYGYSMLSFVGLYLIARYVRLYSGKWLELDKYRDLGLFFLMAFLTAALPFVVGMFLDAPELFKLGVSNHYAYNAPNVVFCSVALFLFFTKLKLQSRFVNWMGASALAVYLIHLHMSVWPHYIALIQYLRAEIPPPVVFGLVVFGTLWLIFIVVALIDQIRIFLWNRIWPLIDKIRCFDTSESE